MSLPEPTVVLGYPTPARGRIPAFASLAEEAAFWDSHDITDFLDESRPVEVTVGQERGDRSSLIQPDESDR